MKKGPFVVWAVDHESVEEVAQTAAANMRHQTGTTLYYVASQDKELDEKNQSIVCVTGNGERSQEVAMELAHILNWYEKYKGVVHD